MDTLFGINVQGLILDVKFISFLDFKGIFIVELLEVFDVFDIYILFAGLMIALLNISSDIICQDFLFNLVVGVSYARLNNESVAKCCLYFSD